ncbi:MAG TPA: hypothetical protein VN895_07125 [Candidatus Acidoferrum sp.]|nr:hypothetical protein [Candidatus Acidoferrum sp.]
MGVGPSRRDDQVEIVLKRADAKLEEWFRRGQKATRKASVSFAAFLRGAKRQSAGALRHEVDDLQAGLKKLSTRLDHVEHGAAERPKKARAHEVTVAPKKRRARPAAAHKAAKPTRAASARKRKKAA